MKLFSRPCGRNDAGHSDGPGQSRRRSAKSRPAAQSRPRLEVLEDRRLLSGGVLDPTFGSGGLVTTTVGADSRAYAVATYPNNGTANDGKVVAAGDAHPPSTGKGSPPLEMAVARYNLDGTLDRTFGGTGKVLTSQGRALAVQVQPDGKVVAAGYNYTSTSQSFTVVRYNPDGTLDATFGSNGQVITGFSRASNDAGETMVLQADGKIVVAGETNPAKTSYEDLALVRYNANGTLDTSFGSGGKVTTRFASPLQSSFDPRNVNLALDPNTSPLNPDSGKLVVVAQLQSQAGAMVVRYNTNGTLDTAFGTGHAGYVNLGNLTCPALAVQSDDRVVVAGTVKNQQTGYNDVGLDRLNPDGTLDTSFGTGGVVVSLLPSQEEAAAVTMQPDGKILVGGSQSQSDAYHNALMVARYNADGSPDASFGVNGFATAGPGTSSSGYANPAEGLALEPDGRIVVAGASYNGNNDSFSLARFLAAGPQIGSVIATPNPVTADGNLTLTAANIHDANPGASITQVAFYMDANGDGKLEPGTDTLLGYGTQADTGAWTFTFSTTGMVAGKYTIFARARDSFGVFGDPVAINVTVN
jgi:uncharacterized delta-60 repeat protein